MRKIIFMVLVLVLVLFTTACFNGIQDIKETVSASAGEDTSGGALAYMDPKIDMFLLVDSADWVYTKELYEGEVYFYPKDENPMASYNGFAISSQKKGNGTVEQYWEMVKNNLKSSIPGFKWNKEDDINVGKYIGCRYHFLGDEFTGDYIFWETDSSLYICSFTSYPDDYDANYELLVNSLGSFKTLEEVQ